MRASGMQILCVVLGGVVPAVWAGVPDTIHHQGAIAVDGTRFSGDGEFRFALVDPDTDSYLWVNDGSLVSSPDAPTDGVILPVINGVYEVPLGDVSLANMTVLPRSVFDDDNVALRIWFDDLRGNGTHQLTPDLSIKAVPYALRLPNVTVDETTGYVGVGASLVDEGAHIALNGPGETFTTVSETGWNLRVDDGNDLLLFRSGQATAVSVDGGLNPGTMSGVRIRGRETSGTGDGALEVSSGGASHVTIDENGIDGFGENLNINGLAVDDVQMCNGGGNVGIGVINPAQRLVVSGMVNSTSGGYRFPDGSTQTSAAFGDGHSLDAEDGTPTDSVFVDPSGNVGIGTTTPQAGELNVEGSGGTNVFFPISMASHTVAIESTTAPAAFITGAAVLGLKSNWSSTPSSNVNYVTFFDSDDQAIGAIDGNGADGVVYRSGSADFAEYLPKLNSLESFAPGEVVGLVGGRVSKSLMGAECAMVVSTAPAVLGNAPKPENADKFVTIAMLGQIPVKVMGAVQYGDYIVADPTQPGLAIAAAPDRLESAATRWIIGRAWASSDEPGIKLINTAVGITGAHVARMAEDIARQEARQNELEVRMARIEAKLIGCQ